MYTFNFTQLVLKSSAWLLIGLLIYYLLSFSKVHLILKTQSSVFNFRNGEKLFSKYLIQLLKFLFSSSYLHKNTFNYIFNYKEEKFKIFPDEKTLPIKKRLRILDSLTTFFKPFLFFALIFFFLRLWINSHFLYNELSITLGEIQKILDSINNFPFIKVLNEYKYFIYFIFGLMTMFVPYIYYRDKLKKKLKKHLKYIIVSISIVTNVSFFGALTSDNVSTINDQLSKLRFEIKSIHSEMYKNVYEIVVINELEDELKKEENSYKKEYERFKVKINSKKNIFKDLDINEELNLSLINRSNDILELGFKVEDFNFNNQKVRSKNQPYSEYNKIYSKIYRDNSSYKEYGGYMDKKERWNKREGNKILEKVEILTKNNFQNKYSKKLKDCIGLFFDFGLDVVSSTFFKELDIPSQKVLNKMAKIFAKENFKNGVINKVISVLNSIMDVEKAKNILQTDNNLHLFSVKEFDEFKKQNSAFFDEKVNYAISKQNELDKKTAINRLDKKLNNTINDIIKSFEGNYKYNTYKEYKKQIIIEYKKELNLNKISLKRLNEIIVSTSLIKNKIKILMRRSNVHPFKKERCPICLFNGVTSSLQ